MLLRTWRNAEVRPLSFRSLCVSTLWLSVRALLWTADRLKRSRHGSRTKQRASIPPYYINFFPFFLFYMYICFCLFWHIIIIIVILFFFDFGIFFLIFVFFCFFSFFLKKKSLHGYQGSGDVCATSLLHTRASKVMPISLWV